MYHYLTNLASFRTLASLKILKIAKTSSIPPSSCFTTSSHYWLPSSLRFKENLPKLALASGAVVVMMLEGVVDSPSSSMETLQSKYLKFRRPKCNDELFHLNPNPQKCSYVKFRKGKEMNLPHETFVICKPNKLAPTWRCCRRQERRGQRRMELWKSEEEKVFER